ncbi:MAG: glycogen/starch/alpha-glucan family phosphorylase [Clostridia bacterium]|nr:glycogen/starch/alpha-glucan family phosphorylase [Clostridia bacterium]
MMALAEGIALSRYQVSLKEANALQLHDAVAGAAMQEIASQWTADQKKQRSGRYASYLSAEYLVGRMVYNNLYAMGILDEVKKEMTQKGIDPAVFEDIEDAALGNGGLGRLAACFLDSAASHDISLFGYGLRYQYGLFKQAFENACQKELPDDWAKFGDPWSIRRDDKAVTVEMKGLTVIAVPYDMPVIGYNRKCIGTLRLWQCESAHPFDFDLFNSQDYTKAAREKNTAEDITKLLYPNDSLRAGKQLRVRQQYVLCSASLQDMLRDFKAQHGSDFARFPEFHAVQLNDTHPTMSIPELMRLLMKEGVEFEEALSIARRTFAYTNHTVMQEALEKWDVKLLNSVSPEMTDIIKRLARKQRDEMKRAGIEDTRGLAIIQGNLVHMAYLAMYGGYAVNGVAAIHSQILKDDVLHAWYELNPDMFQNKTNGITQRRWLGLCNPELCEEIEKRIGNGFMTDLYELEKLKPIIEQDESLTDAFIRVKKEKKRQLAKAIEKAEGVKIPENYVFDVQVKRLHEYKRQFMNALSILDIYYRMKDGELEDLPPVAMIFGAKAAAGYKRAKGVICLINQIAEMVNGDPDMEGRMKVVFVHNYNCSYAEKIIPATDISEQISPAGTEASGTGNMKFMLNGAVTLGTFDGANIEIVEQAGEENNYIFGATLEDIQKAEKNYDPEKVYRKNKRIRRVLDTLIDGTFEDRENVFRELHDAILKGASWHKPDHYYVLLDFDSYVERKIQAIRDTGDEKAFAKKCLYNIAGAGKFSSDRTIQEYAREIWHI